jgi:glycosyltransferase involved in cell wall biosynthesis
MADVSVIIPTFNRLWSLPRAIDSCRRAGGEIEIIVVDDGSSDGTWQWLQQQSDVVSIRQSNWGKDNAVNRGFAYARGDYIKFLDSDDELVEGSISRQLEAARATLADVVAAGYVVRDDLRNVNCFNPWVDSDDFIAQQLGECDSSHYSAYLFRRDFVKDIPHRQEVGFRDDRMFMIEVAIKAPRVVSVSVPGLIHRHHNRPRLQFGTGLLESVTNWQHLLVYQRAAQLLEEKGELTPRRRRAVAKMMWPLAHWIAIRHRKEGISLAKWVFELDPEFRPPENGPVGVLYRALGFPTTETVMAGRRLAINFFRRVLP